MKVIPGFCFSSENNPVRLFNTSWPTGKIFTHTGTSPLKQPGSTLRVMSEVLTGFHFSMNRVWLLASDEDIFDFKWSLTFNNVDYMLLQGLWRGDTWQMWHWTWGRGIHLKLAETMKQCICLKSQSTIFEMPFNLQYQLKLHYFARILRKYKQ